MLGCITFKEEEEEEEEACPGWVRHGESFGNFKTFDLKLQTEEMAAGASSDGMQQ